MLIRQLRRHFKQTNMGVERLIKRIKCAVIAPTSAVNVEGIAYNGLLTQLCQSQERLSNPLLETRKSLLEAGLPVVQTAGSTRSRPDQSLFMKQYHRLKHNNAETSLKDAVESLRGRSSDEHAALAA